MSKRKQRAPRRSAGLRRANAIRSIKLVTPEHVTAASGAGRTTQVRAGVRCRESPRPIAEALVELDGHRMFHALWMSARRIMFEPRKALLRHVLPLAIEQRDDSGCVGVLTDAKPEAVSFYESLGFVRVEGIREGLLSGEPQPMFLAIDTVASLVGG